MGKSLLEKIYIAVLVVIFAGIVLHTPLSVWLGTIFPDATLLIKSWKEILMLLLIPIACVIITRRQLWQNICRDWVLHLIIIYAALHLILAATLFQGTLATFAGLAIDLRYLLFFSLVYGAVRIFPEYRRIFIQTATAGAFIVVGFATLQLFLPPDILSHLGYGKSTIAPYLTVDKNPDYIRVNSTLRGPNPLGAYAGIVLAAATAYVARGRVRLENKKTLVGIGVLVLCSIVALWISYSRSALVAGIVAVLVVLGATVMRKLPKAAWVAAVVLVFSLAGALVANRDSAFVANVLLHENPNGGSSISSNEAHVESLNVGIERLIAQPLGGGVGSTGSASLQGDAPFIIENQYLFIAHEVGWLGLLLFMAIFLGIMNKLWANRRDWLALSVFASGIGLLLVGLLQPVWADDTVSIVWWGLAAIAMIGGKDERKKTKQKTA